MGGGPALCGRATTQNRFASFVARDDEGAARTAAPLRLHDEVPLQGFTGSAPRGVFKETFLDFYNLVSLVLKPTDPLGWPRQVEATQTGFYYGPFSFALSLAWCCCVCQARYVLPRLKNHGSHVNWHDDSSEQDAR